MSNSLNANQEPKGLRNFIKNKFIKDVSLNFKIKAGIVVLSLLASIITGITLNLFAKKTISNQAISKLEVVREANKKHIETFFQNLISDTRLLSKNKVLSEAMYEFDQAFRDLYNEIETKYSSSDLLKMDISLKGYYQTKFLTELEENTITNLGLDNLLYNDTRCKYIQYQYISNNPNNTNQKLLFDKAMDMSAYSNVHFKYHPVLRNFLKDLGIEDLYLIDSETGHIIYSVNKNIDFGTSLIAGPFKNSALASAYKTVSQAEGTNFVQITDMSFYDPAFGKTSMFLCAPVVNNGNKTGILALRLSGSKVNEVIKNYNNKQIDNDNNIYLVGRDYLLRTETKQLFSDKETFLKNIHKNDLQNDNAILLIEKLNTSVLLFKEKDEGVELALRKEEGTVTHKGQDGRKRLTSFTGLNTQNLNWALIVESDHNKILRSVSTLTLLNLGVIIIIGLLVFLIGNAFSKSLTKRINLIQESISKLSGGEVFNEIMVENNDELAQTTKTLNKLVKRLTDASKFADNIGKGEKTIDFKPISEKDEFGHSLFGMSESLEKARKEEEIRAIEDQKRNWSTQGVAKFSDLLRLNNNNIEKLAYSIVSNLVEYLGANQSGLFLISDEGREDSLDLIAAYAYNREKYITKQIKFGEGLVGTCALERKTIHLTEIPQDYINITSGLGDATPSALLIVPMIVDVKLLGVMEIASFKKFEKHEVEFVETIAENVGASLEAVKTGAKTQRLLEESRIKAEEMAAQEEEMRQNLEELKATQEEMHRIKAEETKREQERRKAEDEMMTKLREQNEQMKESQDMLEQQAKELLDKELELTKNLDEMKQAEQALSKKQDELEFEQAMFDALLEVISDRVTFKDAKGKYIRLSKVKTDMLFAQGIKDVKGKTDGDVYGAEHFKKAMKVEQEILDGKVVMDQLEQIKMSDGKLTWGSTSRIPFKDKNGKTKGTVAITKDVTDSKNNEIKLQLFDKIIQYYVNELPLFLMSFDHDKNITRFEGNASKLFKQTKKANDIFTDLDKLIAKQGDEDISFKHSIKVNGNEAIFDVLIIKNTSTDNGYFAIGINNTIGDNTDTTPKIVLEQILKTRSKINQLRKGKKK